jgi:hypothetical protein
MRPFIVIAVLGVALAGLGTGGASEPPVGTSAPRTVRLLETLATWQYPGSKLLGGASMADGGNPLVPSVKCQAILTTPDAVDKVVEFYAKKLIPQGAGTQSAEAAERNAAAKSVSTQDDSQGRPVKLRVLVVNQAKTSTTLVISRAEGEKETHIAWSHYLRLDGSP